MSQSLKINATAQAILVLGMHRSGTSALTGALALCGVTPPLNQIRAGAQNAKGFFEAAPVARLNDRLLDMAEQTWQTWHPLPESRTAEYAAYHDEAKLLITQEFPEDTAIALKDPRICRLVPFWSISLQHANYAPSYVLTIRHPNEVAASLAKRNRLENAHSLLLWLVYNLDAELSTRLGNRAFTSFNHLMSKPKETLSALHRRLGIQLTSPESPAEEELTAFLSPKLRHHSENGSADLPYLWKQTYDILMRWAEYGEDIKDHARLDDIRALCQPLLSQDTSAEQTFKALEKIELPAEAGETYKSIENNSGKRIMEEALQFKRRAYLLNKRLEAKSEKASAMSALSSRQARELAALSKLLLSSEAQTNELALKLREQDTQNTGQEAAETSASGATARIKRLASENKELHALVARQKQARKKLEDDNDALHALVARVENERQAIASSTIWRASKPLRSALLLFRKA